MLYRLKEDRQASERASCMHVGLVKQVSVQGGRHVLYAVSPIKRLAKERCILGRGVVEQLLDQHRRHHLKQLDDKKRGKWHIHAAIALSDY